ncbi:MAG: alcohol dehydrogenase [Blastopirellula sp.]|nr:MAG: alcohol dehydrogenase [Blastopirellula sp.]
MKSVRVCEHGEPLVSVETETPQLKGTEVLLKVNASGICHTDLHLWEGGYDLGGGNRLNIAERGISLPMTMGHEVAGTVISVGPEGDASVIGKECVAYPWLGCGECSTCKRGQENLCATSRSLGVFIPGGYAEYVVLPHAKYCVEHGGIPASQAALLACSGVTTYSAIRKFGDVLKEEPLVILGAGGLGLMALSIVQAMEFKGAIVVDIDPKKLDAAVQAGAIAVVNSSEDGAADKIKEQTGGGAMAVLDLVGAEATINLALDSVARAAQIVVCGLYGGELRVPLPFVPMRPLNIRGSWVGNLTELREVIKLAQDKGIAPVPVTECPLSQANDALMDLKDGKLVGRAVIRP